MGTHSQPPYTHPPIPHGAPKYTFQHTDTMIAKHIFVVLLLITAVTALPISQRGRKADKTDKAGKTPTTATTSTGAPTTAQSQGVIGGPIINGGISMQVGGLPQLQLGVEEWVTAVEEGVASEAAVGIDLDGVQPTA